MLIKVRNRPIGCGRFASLMELYESNYLLVRLLIPRLRQLPEGRYLSRVVGCLDLELRDIQHSRYTTTFKLTYRFSAPGRRACEPDLMLRLYHDARTCEVVSGLIDTRRQDVRRVRRLDASWRLNRFLFKWLRYCLRQGHRFHAAQPLPLPDTGALEADQNRHSAEPSI